MTARRSLIFLALLTATPLALGSSGAAAATGGGRFLTPFREDGAHYAADGFSGGFAKGGATDGNGCLVTPSKPGQTGGPAGNHNAYDCLPAGASMVLMPNGKIAFWNALEGEEQIQGTDSALLDGGRLTVNDESRVLDLRSGKPVFSKPAPVDAGAHTTTHDDDLPLGPFSSAHYAYNNGSMFCSDQKLLANGDILDAGGTDYYSEPYVPVVDKGVIELGGVKNTRVFHASTQRWTLGPTMNYGRWYPSMVTLGNGNLFIASGVEKLIKPVYPTNPLDSGTNVKRSETLDLSAKRPAWKVNPSSADKSLPLFPRFHLLPNGHVYYDAAGQDFNPAGQSYDEALWVTASSYDPVTQTWNDLGVPGAEPDYLAANPTALPYAGFRGSTFSAALTMRPAKVVGGVPVYTAASYLTAGGVLGTSPGSYLSVANSRITTVETAGGESIRTVGTGDMRKARWYGTATPLPNGQVFVSSGADVDEVLNPGNESPIRSTELFTPTIDAAGNYTGGTWKEVGDQARKRTYHNNALLQPDGSVLIGGHAPIVAEYFQTRDGIDLPVREGTNNHHDASFQVWQPPYVNDPGRPVVTRVDPRGRTLVVATEDAARIASVVLMRNTAQTHLVDADARTVSLPVLSRTAATVTVGLPATTNVLPAGPYQLFVNKSKTADLSGRNPADLLPSVGKQLLIAGRSLPVVTVLGQKAAAAAPKLGTAAHTGSGHEPRLPRPSSAPQARQLPASSVALSLAGRTSDDQRRLPVVPVLGLVAVGLAARRTVRTARRP
ncbi:MAG: kelch domain protein [Frankiales bacterium]|nr:kelch domain protein [Frankiales bacterium]